MVAHASGRASEALKEAGLTSIRCDTPFLGWIGHRSILRGIPNRVDGLQCSIHHRAARRHFAFSHIGLCIQERERLHCQQALKIGSPELLVIDA